MTSLKADGRGAGQHSPSCTTARIRLRNRAKAAEAALVGQRIDEAAARLAAKAALLGAEPLSQNRYKLPLFRLEQEPA